MAAVRATGEFYGLTGQTIAGIASAGGAFLVYTGLALAIRRLLAWVRGAMPHQKLSIGERMLDFHFQLSFSFFISCLSSAFALSSPLASWARSSRVSWFRPSRNSRRRRLACCSHGEQAQWNERVADVAKRVDQQHPTEIAFGMATRANIQSAIDKLTARGVTEIVAVPLFVSSHSSVITSPSTARVAQGSAKGSRDVREDEARVTGRGRSFGAHAPAADPASPVTDPANSHDPALNRPRLIGAIVADRAKSISTKPEQEAVIIVAHGPVPEEDNRRWLEDMAVLAEHTQGVGAVRGGGLHDRSR